MAVDRRGRYNKTAQHLAATYIVYTYEILP